MNMHKNQESSILRTKTVTQQILKVSTYSALSTVFSYFLVPLSVNYLSTEQYGIWMTLLSVMSWITLLDFGLGNGLRNKLAESLAVNNAVQAKTYISTAYAAVSLIAFILLVLFTILSLRGQWNTVFNSSQISNTELSQVVLIAGFFALLNFILSLCNQVFFAFQKASINAFGQFLFNALACLGVYALSVFTSPSFLYLATCYGIAMLTPSIYLTVRFYRNHKELIPSFKYANSDYLKNMTSIGGMFFIIQIAALIIFSTDNMIIAQVLGPNEVTPYSVIFKLFSVITMVQGFLFTPLWSAYTDAYTKGDIEWIKSTLRKLHLLMIPIAATALVFIVYAQDIVHAWIGPAVQFPQRLAIFMGIYSIISVWNNIYGFLVNGIGHLKPQMYSAILAGVINIPLSVYFAKYRAMGASGVILGTIISLSLFAVVGPVQVHRMLKDFDK